MLKLVPLSGSAMTPSAAAHAGQRAQPRQQLIEERDAAAARPRSASRAATARTSAPASGVNPGSTDCSRTKLRISRPAPASSITASAISTTTSAPRTRAPPRLVTRAAAAFLQRSGDDAARRVQRRDEAEEQPR